MSYTQQELLQQIQKQSKGDPGLETALLLGSYYETSIGTSPYTWDTAGKYDPPGYSYGPFQFHYGPTGGALISLMQRKGFTEQQAIDYVTTPAGAAESAAYLYRQTAANAGINPNTSLESAMTVTRLAENGTGEINALQTGSYVNVYNEYIAPIEQQYPAGTKSTTQPARGGTISIPNTDLIPTVAPSSSSTSSTSSTSSGTSSAGTKSVGKPDPNLYLNDFSNALTSASNPTLSLSAKQQGGTAPGWSWNPITDVEHIWDDVSGAGTAIANDVDRLAANIWKIILSSLIRAGIALAGLLLVAGGIYILVNKAGLMEAGGNGNGNGNGGGMPMIIPPVE